MTIAYQKCMKSEYESRYQSKMLEPLTLTLKLTNSSKQMSDKAWGAIQQLSSTKVDEKEHVYVHPLALKSLSNLSAESLDMCTESLGSETGAFISETTHFVSSPLSSTNKNYPNNITHNSNSTKMARFPPPLTTMSGSSSMQVKSYREDGRLVIKAVSTPTTAPCFRAERSNGRLKLILVSDSSSLDNKQVDNEEKYQQEEEDERNIENKQGEDIEGIGMEYEVKMGIVVDDKKLQQWTSRCKESGRESNKRLFNWEHFWVAT